MGKKERQTDRNKEIQTDGQIQLKSSIASKKLFTYIRQFGEYIEI